MLDLGIEQKTTNQTFITFKHYHYVCFPLWWLVFMCNYSNFCRVGGHNYRHPHPHPHSKEKSADSSGDRDQLSTSTTLHNTRSSMSALPDSNMKFLQEEIARLQENVDKKDSMLSMLTEGLKEVRDVCSVVCEESWLYFILFPVNALTGGMLALTMLILMIFVTRWRWIKPHC